KLGWIRTPLKTPEPTFEPGIWIDLKHDAIQKINYHGIKKCWQQGNELLGEGYKAEILSVHDPDEYIAQANTDKEKAEKMMDIVEAYLALSELKTKGKASAIGVGAKDWHIIREVSKHIRLDWAMLAVSLTVMHHPPDLLEFIEELGNKGVGVINSAVFHSGFLAGSEFFDYRRTNRSDPEDQARFAWREKFFSICSKYKINPAAACVQFGMSPKGVVSIALNTSRPDRIRENVELVQVRIPDGFWKAMKEEGLIRQDYPFLG
ncbi:MAG: aldo/keto reductase, partial [Bacteroidales bacterium]